MLVGCDSVLVLWLLCINSLDTRLQVEFIFFFFSGSILTKREKIRAPILRAETPYLG